MTDALILLPWFLVFFISKGGAWEGQDHRCHLSDCFEAGCGQLENCLLKEEVRGCSPWELSVLAWPKVSMCLYGRDRPCSFQNLRLCYDTYLMNYTNMSLMKKYYHVASVPALPHIVAGYIRELAANCSLPPGEYSEFQDCAVGVIDWAQRACKFTMPIVQMRYYNDTRVRSPWKTLDDGVIAILGELKKYVMRCKIDAVTVTPAFGPAAGGTNISLIHLSTPLTAVIRNVTFGSNQSWCKVVNRFSSFTKGVLSCDVQPVRPNLIEAPLGVSLHLVDEVTAGVITLVTNRTFTYTNDPIVDDMIGLQTPLSGGTLVTVVGRAFLSAADALFVVRVFFMDDGTLYTQNFYSICFVSNDTIILCPVPPLIEPGAFPSNLQRRILHPSTYSTDTFKPRTGAPPSASRGRQQHGSCSTGESVTERLNDNQTLTYLVDIQLDGHIKTADQYTLDVFADPILKRFDDTEGVMMFRPYWPFSHKYIEIQGEGLTSGVACSNYRVRIGVETCTIVEVTATLLRCKPPETEPLPSTYGMRGAPEVMVIIGTGNLRFPIGFIGYEYDIFDNPVLRYAIVGSIMIVFILIAIIACTCYLCQRRKDRLRF